MHPYTETHLARIGGFPQPEHLKERAGLHCTTLEKYSYNCPVCAASLLPKSSRCSSTRNEILGKNGQVDAFYKQLLQQVALGFEVWLTCHNITRATSLSIFTRIVFLILAFKSEPKLPKTTLLENDLEALGLSHIEVADVRVESTFLEQSRCRKS